MQGMKLSSPENSIHELVLNSTTVEEEKSIKLDTDL